MFVSFAQNLEDVMLWRALGHVPNGFYIDVGANHPDHDSVTKAFYDRGWRGINIEPLAEHIEQLVEARPRDVNLRCAAGDQEGEIELFDTSVRGLATASAEVAQRHRDAGIQVSSTRVPLRQLAAICEEHVHGPVHFLKVDVEGFETAVLRGMDFKRFRPWVVVIEATTPNSGELDTAWEPLLLTAGYRFVYFDGLNRFYLAEEHDELSGAFASPPNVFDEFVRVDTLYLTKQLEEARKAAEWHAERVEKEAAWSREQARIASQESERAQRAEAACGHEAARAEQEAARAKQEAARAADEARRADEAARRAEQAEQWGAEQAALAIHSDARAREIEQYLSTIYASTSWRITAPLRYLMLSLERLRGSARSAVERLLRSLAAPVIANPVARRRLGRLVRSLGLEQRLLPLAWKLMAEPTAVAAIPGERVQLRLHPAALPRTPCLPETLLLPGESDGEASWQARVIGHVEGHYSLAIVNRGLALALADLLSGAVQFVPWHGERYKQPGNLPAPQESGLRPLFTRILSSAARTVSVVHHYPMISDPEPADLRFVLFFWEETTVPAATVELIEQKFDGVLVATRFVKRALLNSGCTRPIFVVPMGIDHLVGDSAPVVAELVRSPEQPLRLLHISSVFERKGPDVLLAAYFDQFSAEDNVELYIKTFPNPHNRIREQLAGQRASHASPPRVVIDETEMDDSALLALYRSAQALVLPTRGEGFNLPAAEAMALGLPVLVTGHGAHTDFCAQETAGLIPFQFAASRSHLRSAGACWVEPDIATLGVQMRHLVDALRRGDGLLEQQRLNAARHVRETYRWKSAADGVLAASRWALRDRSVSASEAPLRVTVLTPWATPCGIAEYSEKLLCAFREEDAISLAVLCDERTAPGSASVVGRVCWRVGDDASVDVALRAIDTGATDVVLVQHQPSLFSLTDDIAETMADLADRGAVVLLELHSTSPLLAERRPSEQALEALRRIDRVIVHQVADLNNLLALGLVDNVMLLPLGVIQPLPDVDELAERQALGIPADALVLGGFGFLLAHKGIDAVIEALPLLAKTTGRRVHYIGIHSFLDERSEQVCRGYVRRLTALGIEDCVTWITDYRPIEECQRLLAAADLLVYPYRATRESASAAVTIGLATVKPVLVTPIPIFADLDDVTYAMNGGEASDIADAIRCLMADPAERAALLERQRAWLAERDWAVLSSRLRSVAQALRQDRRLQASLTTAPAVPVSSFRTEPQILVDVSELYFRDARTGIQRVVRSILGALLAAPPAGFTVRPVYGTPGKGYRYADRMLMPKTGAGEQSDERPVTVSAGDQFLGLDLSAHLFPEAEQWLAALRAAGVRVHFVVYDIIPLVHPQFTVPGIRDAFDHWLRGLARHADSLLCISAAVAREVEQWMRQHVATLPLPSVRSFHLGADLQNSAPTHGLPPDAPQLLSQLQEATVFLMVGTLEPRKGHAQVLAAFEQLWSRGADYCLVLVGKQGWMVDELASKLRAHPELGRRLFWFEGVSDEFLERLYGISDCLIAASWAEGFGLPLVEGAQRGVPILARDIPVFREVAGQSAHYFSGESAESVAQSVEKWVANYRAGENCGPAEVRWLTWEESAALLMAAMIGNR